MKQPVYVGQGTDFGGGERRDLALEYSRGDSLSLDRGEGVRVYGTYELLRTRFFQTRTT